MQPCRGNNKDLANTNKIINYTNNKGKSKGNMASKVNITKENIKTQGDIIVVKNKPIKEKVSGKDNKTKKYSHLGNKKEKHTK